MRTGAIKGIYKLVSLFVVAVFFAILAAGTQAAAQSQDGALLKNQIERIAKGVDGEMGVAIKHIESGEEILVNGDKLFPMASTFKIAIMVEVFYQIKEGKLGLDDEIQLTESDIHIGGTILNNLHVPGITLSIRNLITLMMMVSENSATDILLSKVGIENVDRRMKSLGLANMHINRNCQGIVMDYFGIDREKYKNSSTAEIQKAMSLNGNDGRAVLEARARFNADLRDVSSPSCMNRLVEKILAAEILDRETCTMMLGIMLNCKTGENRLRGMLPPGVAVAHKTGSLPTTCNDSGIIFLPDGRGQVVITVLSREVKDPEEKAAKAIAEIARSAYDYFYFRGGK